MTYLAVFKSNVKQILSKSGKNKMLTGAFPSTVRERVSEATKSLESGYHGFSID
jgi:hypothetical protein